VCSPAHCLMCSSARCLMCSSARCLVCSSAHHHMCSSAHCQGYYEGRNVKKIGFPGARVVALWFCCGSVWLAVVSQWFWARRGGFTKSSLHGVLEKIEFDLESCLLRALPVQRSSLRFKAAFSAAAQESTAPTHRKRKHTKHVKLLSPCQVR